MTMAYLGLGGNLGGRLAALQAAAEVFTWRTHPALRLDLPSGVASLYETEYVGDGPDQPPYLNTAVRVATTLSPHDLLIALHAVESRLGRVRRLPGEPRVIDIDLLLYGDEVFQDDSLTIPHPRLHQRRFVLEPLHEIAGEVVHPVLGLTIGELNLRLRTADPPQIVVRVAGPEWVQSESLARPTSRSTTA
jgi:2-amino-4-hydroxy-6-hydroxymethyldihydropteridine diphosphokinase